MNEKKRISHTSDLFKIDPTEILQSQPKKGRKKKADRLMIDNALAVILNQMKIAGRRPATIQDYERHVAHYQQSTGHVYLDEICINSLYEWLGNMPVSNATRLIRLKCFKAFLSKCRENNWIQQNFWKDVQIKVDKKVKPAATEEEVSALINTLDFSNYFELRDAAAILLMFRTGIRLSTLAKLEERHLDFNENTLNLTGDTLKNHETLKIPFDDYLSAVLQLLIKQNKKIREAAKQRNSLIFITKDGTSVFNVETGKHMLQRRLWLYAKEFNLQNINAHALRRGFATNLLKQGASIPLISKALGHSDIAVTTQYLYLDMETVAEELRGFL